MAKSTNSLVTKDYLDRRLQAFKVELKDELKTDLRKELKGELSEFKDELKCELIEIKDEIVGEIKAMREEFDAHQFSHSRIQETLEELRNAPKT